MSMPQTNSASARHWHLADRFGIGLAALCALHCVATVAILSALASFGGALLNPIVHEVGLMMAIILGAIGLGSGVRQHGSMMPTAAGSVGLATMAWALVLPHGMPELLATLAGLALLTAGHFLNVRARR